jgi:hypothetical protein
VGVAEGDGNCASEALPEGEFAAIGALEPAGPLRGPTTNPSADPAMTARSATPPNARGRRPRRSQAMRSNVRRESFIGSYL